MSSSAPGTKFRTDQEAFWAGEFGSRYIDRNRDEAILAAKTHLMSNLLRAARGVSSVVEFGPNIGLNLLALKRLLPNAEYGAIEINADAVEALRALGWVEAHHGSILEQHFERTYDMVLISGVLIHIDPDMLGAVYDNLHAASARYICLSEYYNPTPVMVPYRGHENRLFKRDFAGEMMDRFPDLRLVDYGFQYHRDPNFPADDVTWFVLEKTG
ncbi:MAG: pseudaminic acid biosynthesis-associated methylase [Rhodospirillaceae bacterium]|jgi:pseudaminic acid biosynthesis-associated methylase|nr:pseudaminic acid biosynthesis-associated methylase [Rhodospirillaceae bacterium]MBT6138847.1 pseudaminic acid biosynthesis-associated methylase [Rhodospirillaceae bacterium]